MIQADEQRTIQASPKQTLLSLLFIVSLALSCGCIRRERQNPSSAQSQPSQTPDANQPTARRININTASAAELDTLPGIGKALAERIIEHREKYGPFRRPEHLLIVRGISDKRFRELRDLITVE